MYNKPSFLVQTLGCKLNQLESESITDVFFQAEFKQITIGNFCEHPSLIIVNTCTVTSKADQKARGVIRKALRDYPNSCVIVTGCYANLNKDDILKIDNSNERRLFVVKKEDVLKLPEFFKINDDIINVINQLSGNQSECLQAVGSISLSDNNSQFEFNPLRFSDHTRSFLKIQDGCDKHCTYCRIRLARGSSISLESEKVLERLKILEKDHAETVLTGVNISQYNDSKRDLGQLLEYLLVNTNKIAIRLSSLAPESINEELVNVFSGKRIRPHFHLSIQSGSEKVLKQMGRYYNNETIKRACKLLRNVKNDPFLACDIITGFPGETDAEFEQTYSLCKNLDFAWIHVFPYSKRPGTPAYSYTGTVHAGEIKKRVKLLTDLAWQGREAYIHRWIGKEVDILVEKGVSAGFCKGISENYLKALIRYNQDVLLPGVVLRCQIREKNLQNTELHRDYDVIAESLFILP